MIRLFRELYLTNRFFMASGGMVAILVLLFFFPELSFSVKALAVVLVALCLADFALLFFSGIRLKAHREVAPLLSLGDDNELTVSYQIKSKVGLNVRFIDELPYQLQLRDFQIKLPKLINGEQQFRYHIHPVERGEYRFGKLHFFLNSRLGLVSRRISVDESTMIPVYPSVIQMKKYSLQALQRISFMQGIKKTRRLGHSYEFDQIKDYVRGDDYRSINWKATGRAGKLMVNQYEDEKAQQIYCIIDKGRSMSIPFHGLTLMDYAINSSLVISNVALQKHDKAGYLSFSDKIGAFVKADSKRHQLKKILDQLYREKERKMEANYELLFQAVMHSVRNRSLLFLYSNFESLYALHRVLPLLRKLNRMHLLVVILFENTEIAEFSREQAADTEDIYYRTTAKKFIADKIRIQQELRRHHIQTILTQPKMLSINTMNKYLELKARGLI